MRRFTFYAVILLLSLGFYFQTAPGVLAEAGAVVEGEHVAEGEIVPEGETPTEGEVLQEGEPVSEGEPVVEGEEPPVDGLTDVALVFPTGDIFVPAGSQAVNLVLAARIQGEGTSYHIETTRVYFVLNDRYVTAEGHFQDLFYLPVTLDLEDGLPAYPLNVKVIAYDEDGEHYVESAVHSPAVFAASDMDLNGFVDDPFSTFSGPGDCWIYETAHEGSTTNIFMMALAPGKGTTPLIFQLPPTEPETEGEDASEGETIASEKSDAPIKTQYTLLEVPGQLVEPVEKGILIFASTTDAETLYAPYEVEEMLWLQPGTLAPGSRYQDLKIILSIDQGSTFYDLPESRTSRRPLTLIFPDCVRRNGMRHEFSGYPTVVDSDPQWGIGLKPEEGDWSAEGIAVDSLSQPAGYLRAVLKRLALTGYFEISVPGFLTVIPSPETGIDFGAVPLNKPSFKTIAVANHGDTAINCSVRLKDSARVFFLQSDQALRLPPGATQNFKLQFNPGEAKAYTATLVFESSDGNYQSMVIKGQGEAEAKEAGLLGCGMQSAAPLSYTADLLLLLLVAAVLITCRKRCFRS